MTMPQLRALLRARRDGLPETAAKRRRLLFAERLEPRRLLATVTGVSPLANSHNAPASTSVVATFDENINAATATPQSFVVHSAQRGNAAGVVNTNGASATVEFDEDFFPGDLVRATVTSAVQGTGPAAPYVWQFRTAASGGNAEFSNNGQSLGDHVSWGISLGDLDSDGDLDAFIANGSANRVWLNNGGRFSDSGQSLGDHSSWAVSLGDLDNDGDLDAAVANFDSSRVWLNVGGIFTDTGQSLGSLRFGDIELGDLDGDGDLDVFVVNDSGSESPRVWLNNGSGRFTDTGLGQTVATDDPSGVSLGDLDGDGDLDAFVTNWGYSAVNRIWFNNGRGSFTQHLSTTASPYGDDVALGDVDGDGDLDAFTANADVQPNRVWLNNGSGGFIDSGMRLGNHASRGVALGDLDGDGDLDAFVANYHQEANRVWINNGGVFGDSGQDIGNSRSFSASLGDLDGDGDLDVFVANRFWPEGSDFNRVWINQNSSPPSLVSLSIDEPRIAEAAGATILTATLSAVSSLSVTVDLEFMGTATAGTDYTNSSSQISIPTGSLSGTATITAVQDLLDEPDETILVDISGIQNGTEAGTQQVTIIIADDDVPLVPDVTLAVDNAAIAEAGGVATFEVTLSEATTVPVTVELGISGTAAVTDDYTVSGNQLVFEAGTTTASITVTAVDDEIDELDETVDVEITSVTGGSEAGVQQATITIIDDDDPPGFTVTSLTATTSGFVAEFATDLDAGELNLYDAQAAGLGKADAVLEGPTGAVTGSLVVGPGPRRVTFIKSGEPLATGDYAVTLRSSADGFKDVSGLLLDGNGDGTAGDNYTGTFNVAAPLVGAISIGFNDFVRGPGQGVNMPANASSGIPVTISEGSNVRAIDLRVRYDPALLNITGATVGAGMPAGASVIVNTNTPGLVILVFFSSNSLPAGSSTFVKLQASVPVTDSSGIYGKQQVLDIHSVTISDGNDNEFPVIADDALHLASYFADVSGNGRINASDAAQVARFAALIDTGFAGSLLTDPNIVGDISGNRRVNAADASRVAQFAALIDVPEIPPIPGAIAAAGSKDAGGFENVVLLEREKASNAETDNELASPSASIGGWGSLPNRRLAVDTVLALAELTADEVDKEAALALEEVMDQLFSLPDDVLFASG